MPQTAHSFWPASVGPAQEEDTTDDVFVLRDLVQKQRAAFDAKSSEFSALQTKLRLFAGKYKQKEERVAQLEADISKSVMRDAQAQVAIQHTANLEQMNAELEAHNRRLAEELSVTSQALQSKTSQYEASKVKMNELSATINNKNTVEELKKLREANRTLKHDVEGLRKRLQQSTVGQPTRVVTSSSSFNAHQISSSDDEAAFQLNSSHASIKSEDEAPDPAHIQDLADILEDALDFDAVPGAEPNAAPAPSAAQFREPVEKRKPPKAPVPKSAAPKLPKAKRNASAKKLATAEYPPVAALRRTDAEFAALERENADLRAEIDALAQTITSLRAEVAKANQDAKTSQDQLASLRRRLAAMIEDPGDSARPYDPPVAAPFVFGIPDDDEPAVRVDSHHVVAPPTIVDPPPLRVPSREVVPDSFPVASAAAVVRQAPAPSPPSPPAETSPPAAVKSKSASMAKGTSKKRGATTELPAVDEPDAGRAPKRAKTAEVTVTTQKKTAASAPKLASTSLAGPHQPRELSLPEQIQSAVDSFPAHLLGFGAVDIFSVLLDPAQSGTAVPFFTRSVLQHILALLKQHLEPAAAVEAFVQALTLVEANLIAERVGQDDFDVATERPMEIRVAAAFDAMFPEGRIDEILDYLQDSLFYERSLDTHLTRPRGTDFYVILWCVTSPEAILLASPAYFDRLVAAYLLPFASEETQSTEPVCSCAI